MTPTAANAGSTWCSASWRAWASPPAFALQAFEERHRSSTILPQVAAGAVQPGKRFQLGGMVKKGSVQRAPGTLEVRFVVTDFQT